jgi:hypothetical protein
MPDEKVVKGVPFLRCLKCFGDVKTWATLVNNLSLVQEKRGGASIVIPAGVMEMQPGYVDAPHAAEEQDIKTNKEMAGNSDVKVRVK